MNFPVPKEHIQAPASLLNQINAYYDGQRFKNLEMSDIFELIAKISDKLGIVREQSHGTLNEMYNLLVNHYGGYTDLELYLAADLYCMDKLKVNGHFQSISAEFIGKLLAAYKEHERKKVNEFIAKAYHAREKEQSERSIAAQKDDKSGEWWYHKILNEYLKNSEKLPYGMNWNRAFFYAEEQGFIKMSIEDKKKFSENVKDQLLREGRDNPFNAKIIRTPMILAYECRKRLLINHLKNTHNVSR